MRNLRPLLIAVLATAVGAGVIVAIIVLAAPQQAPSGSSGKPENLPRFPVTAPLVRAADATGPGIAQLADPTWLAATAKATGIPERALAAYAGVAIRIQDSGTGCDIGWNTLAGIGEIESHHGTIFGGSIQPDGTAKPAIFGVPLAGGAVANIPDSDKGAIDGDATIDRAVGPMQLIPQTWRNWHVDANGDGVEDPQNIDDASFAAAHYLCRAGGQAMGTENGWRTAVLAYNESNEYLTNVIRYATQYAKAAAAQ